MQEIVTALKNANCGNDVFLALCEVPSENLTDMHNMIVYILENRNNNE